MRDLKTQSDEKKLFIFQIYVIYNVNSNQNANFINFDLKTLKFNYLS